MLNDFISKQDINIIKKIEIYDDKVIFPMKINVDEFYKEFSEMIKNNEFTTEKALFVASKYNKDKAKSSIDLLNAKLKFK